MPPPTSDNRSRPPAGERRAAPRLQLLTPVAGRDDNGHDVTLVNISEGGMMVHTRAEAAVGQLRQFRFHLPESQAPIEFAARIVYVLRIHAAEGPTFGLGLELLEPLAADVREALKRLTSD